jgi:hypothetical protein
VFSGIDFLNKDAPPLIPLPRRGIAKYNISDINTKTPELTSLPRRGIAEYMNVDLYNFENQTPTTPLPRRGTTKKGLDGN